MRSRWKVIQAFDNNPKEIDKEDDQTRDGGTLNQPILIDAKIEIAKKGQKQSWLGEVH